MTKYIPVIDISRWQGNIKMTRVYTGALETETK